MIRRLTINAAVHILLPLLAGALIYVTFRHDTACCFPTLQFTIDPPPQLAAWVYQQHWILYHLPDGLWLYAFVAFNLLIWKDTNRFGLFYALVALFIAIFSEFLQKNNLLAGTYDRKDIYTYLCAFILALLILGRKHLLHVFRRNENGTYD